MALVLDIETSTLFRKHDRRPREMQLKEMVFGCAVTYDSISGEYHEWGIKDLIPLWAHLKNRVVCGWNIIGFDIPIVRYTLQGDGYPAFETIMAYDLFHSIKEKTGRWYSLEIVAQENLGRSKVAEGTQAAQWLDEGLKNKDETLLRKALDYCRDDVALEYALYAHLQGGKALKLPPIKGFHTTMFYKPTGEIVEG